MSDQRVWLVNGRDKVTRTYLVSGSLHDNLDPGRYAFVCFIPSPGDRVAHAAKGMVYEFER